MEDSKSRSHESEDRTVISRRIKEEAVRLGFDLVGIAPAVLAPGFDRLCQWLDRGCAGEMSYIERRREAYAHPSHVLDGVKSLVMLAINYKTTEPPEPGPLQGRVSRYAWGQRDYHLVLREMIGRLAEFVRHQWPGFRTRGVVDTAPLLERDFAQLAGLGWIGKNTMLINKHSGSWLFLGALLVDYELEYDPPLATDHCGTCTRCLDACPTHALTEPYVLDARRCLSYLTIELRDQPIPIEFRAQAGSWVFGCDVCQDVCPWNRKAPSNENSSFSPRDGMSPMDLLSLLSLTDEEFRKRFHDTPLSRVRRAGLLRNAAIALGNGGDARAVTAIVHALQDSDPIVRGAAAWSLGRIGNSEAMTALKSRLDGEDNADVAEEILLAIQMQDEKGATE